MAMIRRDVALFLFQVWILLTCLVSSLMTDSGHGKFELTSVVRPFSNQSLISGRNSNMEMIQVMVALTDFITSNVRQSFDNTDEDKDHKEKITHFERIQREYENHKEELKTINREIKLTGLLMGYSQHEEKIKQSLLALHQYLEQPDESNQNIFMLEAAHLTSSISVIVDGLLGQNAFNPDIMAVMLDSIGCHGRQLQKKIKFIMSIVMTGLWVRGEYQRLRNTTELDSSNFKKYIMTSTDKLAKRFDDMAVDCQADEEKVVEDMRNIMKSLASRSIKSIADSLLKFLEDKYDTKKWIVVVLPNLSENWNTRQGNWSGITSAKWHYVLEKATVALAISANRSDSSTLYRAAKIFLEKFDIPIRTVPRFLFGISKYHAGVKQIHEHLNRFLLPLRAKSRVDIQTLVVEVDPAKVIIVATSETEYLRFSNQLNCCHLVMVVIKSSDSALDSIPATSYSLRKDSNEAGLLRNEFTQSYLAVNGDRRREGLPVILDREWRNSSGQRWRFVNNHLMNDHDKCLTAWSERSSLLHQYDCHRDWVGQIWQRNGLQIINGYQLCLDYEGVTNDGTAIVVQNYCDSTPSFLWADWETSCEDAMVPTSVGASRAFRNEFSRRYLSVYGDEEYVFDKPWNNSPGKNWTFVDETLRNGFGKCLVGIGWYVQQVDCDRNDKAKRWTFNEKRQIVSAEGYCLSVGNREGYVLYSYCKDSSAYRWWYH